MKTLLIAISTALLAGTAVIAPSLTPCTTEDQESACYWDKGSNGKGSAFLVTVTGAVIYLPTPAGN